MKMNEFLRLEFFSNVLHQTPFETPQILRQCILYLYPTAVMHNKKIVYFLLIEIKYLYVLTIYNKGKFNR